MNEVTAASAAGGERADPSRRRWRARVRCVIVLATLLALGFGLARCLTPGRPARRLPYPMRIPGALDLALVPVVTRFDFPLGTEHGAMSYNAQRFGTRGDVSAHAHLGDDLNGIGGYNTDLGDPVYAVADGRVLHAAPAGPGWGNVVILLHTLADGGPPRVVQSFYAHLDRIDVRVGETVGRGEPIGTVGTADGRYYAHLHFEMRDMLQPWIGTGYADDAVGWINPSVFLRDRRGAPDDDLAPSAAVPARDGSASPKKDRQGDTATRSRLPLLHFCPGGVGPSTPHDP